MVMQEYYIYGKYGLFYQITVASAIMNGRYAVLPKGGGDLNRNNLLSDLDLPKDKYPGVFCLPPVSDIGTVQQAGWETFSFRLLFLTTTYSTGDNKIKSPDFNTNSSLHKMEMDWSDMKDVALNFMNALEKIRFPNFKMNQGGSWRIIRVTDAQNDRLSGVMLMFSAMIAVQCVFTDIDPATVAMPAIDTHETHFH